MYRIFELKAHDHTVLNRELEEKFNEGWQPLSISAMDIDPLNNLDPKPRVFVLCRFVGEVPLVK